LGSVYGNVLAGLHQYCMVLKGLVDHNISNFAASQIPRLTALHLSMAAISLQWLSSMPPGSLLALRENCLGVCHVIAQASCYGLVLMRHHLKQQPAAVQAAGGSAQLMAANQAAAQLSVVLADKLLSECRGLLDRGGFSGSNSSSNRNMWHHNGASSGLMLLQSCEHVMRALANAFAAAVDDELSLTAAQPSSSGRDKQLPVSHVQFCQLLQESLRLMEAATAPATVAVAAAVPFSGMASKLKSDLSGYVTPFLGWILPVAAVAGSSNPDVLQLFGLLCSCLKVYSNGSITSVPTQRMWTDFFCQPGADQQDVSTGVVAAVGSMVKAGLDSASSSSHPGSSSSAAGHNTTSSSACTAALPWLVLLGRCCHACAALVQHWQISLQYDGPPTSLQHAEMIKCTKVLAQNLHQLQSSLADVVQWLAAAGTVQHLSALGYQPQDLQQQLASTAAAISALSNGLQAVDIAGGPNAVLAILQAAQEQLQAAGRVLACFAIPHACNNPSCSNVSGPSEAKLVGGRSCICAGCRTARYCGRVCQRAAWRQHKPVCKALAAAATTAGAAATVAPTAAAAGGVPGAQLSTNRQA
jgi:hypothetical protein